MSSEEDQLATSTEEEEETSHDEEGEDSGSKKQETSEEGESSDGATTSSQESMATTEPDRSKPMTTEIMREPGVLSNLARTGDGTGYAFVRADIRDRGLTDIEIIGTLEHLRYIDAAKNKLFDISPLSKLKYLLWLDISHNLLSGDAITKLTPRPYLQWANFENNKLTVLPREFPLLTFLNMSRNSVSTIVGPNGLAPVDDEDDVLELPELQSLDLRQNSLTTTMGLVLPALKALDLSENRIQKLVLTGLPELETLIIKANPLSKLDIQGETFVKALRVMDLRDCRIESFEEVAKLAVIKTLRSLQLAGNPIDHNEDYRMEALVAIPHLDDLDGEPFTSEDRTEAADIIAERKAAAEAKAAAEREAEAERKRVEAEEAERIKKEQEEREAAEQAAAAAEAAAAAAEAEAEAAASAESISNEHLTNSGEAIPPPPEETTGVQS